MGLSTGFIMPLNHQAGIQGILNEQLRAWWISFGTRPRQILTQTDFLPKHVQMSETSAVSVWIL